MINLSVLFCRNPDIDENIQVHRCVYSKKKKNKKKKKNEKKKRKRKMKTKERKEEHKKKEMKIFDKQSLILGYPLKSKI